MNLITSITISWWINCCVNILRKVTFQINLPFFCILKSKHIFSSFLEFSDSTNKIRENHLRFEWKQSDKNINNKWNTVFFRTFILKCTFACRRFPFLLILIQWICQTIKNFNLFWTHYNLSLKAIFSHRIFIIFNFLKTNKKLLQMKLLIICILFIQHN